MCLLVFELCDGALEQRRHLTEYLWMLRGLNPSSKSRARAVSSLRSNDRAAGRRREDLAAAIDGILGAVEQALLDQAIDHLAHGGQRHAHCLRELRGRCRPPMRHVVQEKNLRQRDRCFSHGREGEARSM